MRPAEEKDRVRFRNGNEVVEGRVVKVSVGGSLVEVRTDDKRRFLVDRYSLAIVDA